MNQRRKSHLKLPLDVGLYQYSTLFRRFKFWKSVPLEDDARVLADIIRDAKDYETAILVGHSMGGLLCMAAIRYLIATHPPDTLSRIGGLILMATPQTGSQKVPKWLGWFSKDFYALRPHGDFITRIHETFINSIVFNESKTVLNKMILPTWAILGSSDFWVDKLSASIRLPADRQKMVSGSHTEIVKPITKQTDTYRFFCECVRTCFERQVEQSKILRILPAVDVTYFTGRELEISRLSSLIFGDARQSVIGLWGGPGVGKSALACYFADEHTEQFPDGVIGLDARGKDANRLASDFAALISEPIDAESELEPSAIMQSRFASRRALLIIDNAERSDIRTLI